MQINKPHGLLIFVSSSEIRQIIQGRPFAHVLVGNHWVDAPNH